MQKRVHSADWPQNRLQLFLRIAHEIVVSVRDDLTADATDKLRAAFENVGVKDLERISVLVDQAFLTKKMGLRDLVTLARKELAIIAIKKITPKYTVSNDLEPVEYFEKWYLQNFGNLSVPVNSISIIDPNLHAQLKKSGQFSEITRRLINYVQKS
jgi:hypothetical protein